MGTIEELLGTPLHQMTDEELMTFVRSSRAKRTTLMEDNTTPAKKSKATGKKAPPPPDDLLDFLEGDLD